MTRSRVALTAPLLALILPLLNTPLLIAGPWSGRFVLVAGIGCLAIPLLLLSLGGERSAVTVGAGLFVGIAAISTALSNSPANSLWGSFVWGTGFIFVAGLVGCWLIGGATDGRGRLLTERAFIVAASVNASIGVAQVLFDLSRASFDLDGGRAYGLQGNAVYLAGLTVGGLWLIFHQRTRLIVAVPLVLLLSTALQVSGARSGLLAAVLGLALAALSSWRRAGVLGLAVVGGLGVGLLVSGSATATTGTGRIAAASGGISPRLEAWMSAAHAVRDHPVVGAGPGRFQAATSKYRTLRFARSEGPGRLYRDAHNILVEYATTTGLLGLIAFLWWVGAAVVRAGVRTPLTAGALGLLVLHLVEPQSVALTPLAFLLLGAAGPPLRFARSSAARRIAGMALLPATAVMAALGYGFYAMNQASLDFDRSWAVQADRYLPVWSDKKELLARITVLGLLEAGRHEDLIEALPYRQAAVDADPEDPFTIEDLAAFELQLKLVPQATTHLTRVLELNPWAPNSLTTLGRILAGQGQPKAALVLLRRSVAVAPDQPETKALIKALETTA